MDTVIQGAIDMMTNSGVFHRKELATVSIRIHVMCIEKCLITLADQQAAINDLNG